MAVTRGFPPPAVSSERHSLRANAVAVFAGQLSTWALTAVTLAILPRYLGPEQMGQLGVGLTFGNLGATAAGLGIQTLITRDIARNREAGAALLPTAFWLSILMGSLAGVGAMLIAGFLGYGPGTRAAIAMNALTIPFNLVTLVGFSALQGIEVMRFQAVYDAGNKLVFLAGTALIIALDLGFNAYLVLSAISAVAVAVPAFVLPRRYLPFRLLSFSFARARYLVVKGLPFSTVNLFLIVYLAADVFLLSVLAGDEAVGIYTAPQRIFGTLLFAPTIVTTVVFPRMAAASHETPGEVRRLARVSLELVVGVTLPVAVLTVGAGDAGLVWLIGHGFEASGPVVVVLALALLPTSINMVAHRVLIAVDRQHAWTVVMTAGLVAKVALCLALIPLFDRAFGSPALGAAAGLAVVESGMMLAGFVLMPKGYFNRSSLALLGKLTLGAVIALEVMYFAHPLGFVATGAAGALAYAAVVLFLGAHRPADFRAAFGQVRHRSRDTSPETIVPSVADAPRSVDPVLFAHSRFKGTRTAPRGDGTG